MQLTPEQREIGKHNFGQAVGVERREFLKSTVAAGTGLGALYFGYEKLKGEPVRTAFIGTGDEGNVLINEHPTDYMDIVAIADLRPANRERTFTGSHPVARRGLNAVVGRAKADSIQKFDNHRDLLAAKDELGLEAVVIAVPLNQHAPVAIECMEAGLHVLCEKLMAKTVTACKEMIRLADQKDLMLAVGHQRHYSVLYANAAHLTEHGVLGDIKFIRAQWHRNNSFPNSDAWQKWKGAKGVDKDLLTKMEQDGSLKDFGYETAKKLIDWRLYSETGGGLMAELGSHQLDAASIFLGKVHPLAVQGYGGKNFFGIPDLGPESAQADTRDIDDQIFVTFEFPGKHYVQGDKDKERDVSVVTYSSMNTNRWEPYGEAVFGSRASLVMSTEKEALLYKEASKASPGGIEQRIWAIEGTAGGAALDSYETSAPAAAAKSGPAETVSRGYREEMEHFCYCIRTGKNELRCNGRVAMADAIMALTANLAMKHQKRIVFKEEWFDPASDAAPETDEQVTS